IDYANVVTSHAFLQHGLHEVAAFAAAACSAVESADAKDEVAIGVVGDQVFSENFGGAVDVQRGGAIGFVVASIFRVASENVVGAEVHESGAGFLAGDCQLHRRGSVYLKRKLGLFLTLCHAMIGSGIEHEVGLSFV